jgi:hypothetical protein
MSGGKVDSQGKSSRITDEARGWQAEVVCSVVNWFR